MRLIKNLIEVKIPDDQLTAANFKDGLKINVKSEQPFIVNAYWIVKIFDIHQEIEKDWQALHEELASGKFLCDNNKSLYQNERQIYETIREEVQCDIRPPKEIDTSNLCKGELRDFYPLVIVVTCLNNEASQSFGSAAAANIHLVHIRDSTVPVKTHVIKQYIKQIDGRILDISQLYAEESAACFICFEEATREEDGAEEIKLFCLLPCRHSPICSNCITRIRECPKCRCPIASVFDVNTEAAQQAAPAAARPTIDPSLSHLYDDANGSSNSTGGRRGQNGGGFFGSLKSMFGL